MVAENQITHGVGAAEPLPVAEGRALEALARLKLMSQAQALSLRATLSNKLRQRDDVIAGAIAMLEGKAESGDLSALRHTLESLRKQTRSLDVSKEMLDHRLSAELRNLRKENAALVAELNASRKEIEAAKSEMKQMQPVGRAGAELVGATAAAHAAASASASHDTVADLERELSATRAKLEKYKKAKKEAEREKNELMIEATKTIDELEVSKTNEVDLLKQEIQALKKSQSAVTKQQLAAAMRLIKSSRKELASLSRDTGNFSSGLQSSLRELGCSVAPRLATLASDCETLRENYSNELRERKRLLNLVQELRGNIRVLCRCRPPTELELREHAEQSTICASFPEENVIELVNDRDKRKCWEFDKVFRGEMGQEEVYGEVSSLVLSLLDGYNVCIFAYGQTGSGKTHTMMGPSSDAGVNSRALADLFEKSTQRRDAIQDEIEVSILEVYNETLVDLLVDDTSGPPMKLEIRQGENGNYVPNLSVVPVRSLEEVLSLMKKGDQNRSSACTNMNEHSSRSHLILSVYVRSTNVHTGVVTRGKLHLVDLAGSERISKSGATGQALKEAQNINKSLSALGDVIAARAQKKSHTPYRNSTLTYLLQDSLSHDSKTLMVVCISPVIYNAEESFCSLNFAARVRTVELGKATKNVEILAGGSPTLTPSSSSRNRKKDTGIRLGG